MKKVLMLALLVLGTTAMVNAQTAPAKTTPTKEVKMGRHKKEKSTSINKEVTKKGIKKHSN